MQQSNSLGPARPKGVQALVGAAVAVIGVLAGGVVQDRLVDFEPVTLVP